ncbi:MAG: hypothetical protein V1908_03635 [Candidatus Peregrinibacteria bacterium]
MSVSFIIFIIVHLFALVYFLEVMRRVRQRAKEFPLRDSRETLPYGFLRLRHIVILYTLLYILWIILSIGFYVEWLDVGTGSMLPRSSETNLNI